MKVLITGACGFVGQHLTRELVKHKHEVYLGVRNANIKGCIPERVYNMDVTDPVSVQGVLSEVLPDAIVHLAAQSKVKSAWEDPEDTFRINTLGTINLVKQACLIIPTAKIITIGSSEEYGSSARSYESIDESTPCHPQNPYASSKLAAGEVALQISGKSGSQLVHARPFNHFGPGQELGFVVSDFSSQIAAIEAGFQEPIIRVGDLSVQRDFTDVRDIVIAYRLLLEHDTVKGIFNISSGVPRRISNILEFLIGKSTENITVKVDHNKFRSADVSKFVGDSTKIRDFVGWAPTMDFEESLMDTLNWWRCRISRSKEQ